MLTLVDPSTHDLMTTKYQRQWTEFEALKSIYAVSELKTKSAHSFFIERV